MTNQRDDELERSTTRWMMVGAIVAWLLIIIVVVYACQEPNSRSGDDHDHASITSIQMVDQA